MQLEHDPPCSFKALQKIVKLWPACVQLVAINFIGHMGDCWHADDIMQLPGPKFQMLCFQIANYTSTDIHKFSLPHSNVMAWYSWALIYCSYSTSYTQCLPLSPDVDCSWPCAGNWPPLESSLQKAGGEDLQNTEEGTGQEDPGSWPRDPPPQHSREEGGEESPGTHTTEILLKQCCFS